VNSDKDIWVNDMAEGKTVKTTINIREDLWKKFSICVIEEKGYRKKNEVVEALIRKYVLEREKENK